MKNQKVAIVLQISSYEEDATPVLQSLTKLKDYFHELHIVYPSSSHLDMKAFSDLKDKIVTHEEELITSALSTSLLLIYVQPDHAIEEAAFTQLIEQAIEKRTSCDHYAVRGKLDCQNIKYPFLLGFLWLVAVFDQFRTWANCWGYHTREDLRATKITPHFPSGTTVYAYKHAWFFSYWSRIASIQYAEGYSLMEKPKDALFVLRYIYNHPHLSVTNVGWWLFYLVYYFGFALPWWNVFLNEPAYREASIRSSVYILVYWIAYRNVFNPFWLCLWVFHIVIAMWIVSSRFKHAHLMWIFLMPLYVTLSPLIFLVAKNKIFLVKKDK